MEKRTFITGLLMVWISSMLAQAPQSFKYQTVIRNTSGEIIASQQVTLKIEILQGNMNGTVVCNETYYPTTNEFGLVNLEVGSQDPTAFSAINWANGPYFTRVNLNGNVMGTSELLSVPYALYAEKSGGGSSEGFWSQNGNDIYYNSGEVGIGITNPLTALHILGDVTIDGGAKALRIKSGGVDHAYVEFYADSENPDVRSGYIGYTSGGQIDLKFRNQFDGGNISFYPGTGGNVTVPVLEITGGSDLSEPFIIAETLEEGTVVVIDESNPGHLKESSESYDKKVAGIVSGAGGIMTGLILKQEGMMEGTQNIALSGRVYVKTTTENGIIKPGDLLTTSSLPGHAMKATNKKQYTGAIIGKAMSSLEVDEGLVLVLVNLQ